MAKRARDSGDEEQGGRQKRRPSSSLVRLDNADFDSAFAAATMWSSAGLNGLETWLTAAQRRHDLDKAVNRLVTLFVQHAAGQI